MSWFVSIFLLICHSICCFFWFINVMLCQHIYYVLVLWVVLWIYPKQSCKGAFTLGLTPWNLSCFEFKFDGPSYYWGEWQYERPSFPLFFLAFFFSDLLFTLWNNVCINVRQNSKKVACIHFKGYACNVSQLSPSKAETLRCTALLHYDWNFLLLSKNYDALR